MRFAFDHQGPEGEPFVIPDERLIGHLRPRSGERSDLDRMTQEALRNPMGGVSIARQARRHREAVLLIDDATRSTPTARLLPHVLEALAQVGITRDRVTILVAPGTHRPMDRHELRQKLGDLVDDVRVVQHDHRDQANLQDLGQTEDGMPVVVHRLLGLDRLCIGIGTVAVHGIMGYSGGAKIASIGAAGPATESWTHWQAATRFEVADLMGVPDNPLRRNIEEAGRMAGLDAVLNVVTDPEGRVQRVAYGEPKTVHRALVPTVQEHFAARLPGRAEVAIIDANPATRDYWQSVKALYAAELVVRAGGAAIIVAPNPEGVAANHPNVEALAGLPYSEIVRRVEAGEERDVIGAAIAAFTARTRRHMSIHMVTRGIDDERLLGLGIEPSKTVQDALDEVGSALGRDLRVAVLERGGDLLPVVAGVNDERVRLPTAVGAAGIRS